MHWGQHLYLMCAEVGKAAGVAPLMSEAVWRGEPALSVATLCLKGELEWGSLSTPAYRKLASYRGREQ